MATGLGNCSAAFLRQLARRRMQQQDVQLKMGGGERLSGDDRGGRCAPIQATEQVEQLLSTTHLLSEPKKAHIPSHWHGYSKL